MDRNDPRVLRAETEIEAFRNELSSMWPNAKICVWYARAARRSDPAFWGVSVSEEGVTQIAYFDRDGTIMGNWY